MDKPDESGAARAELLSNVEAFRRAVSTTTTLSTVLDSAWFDSVEDEITTTSLPRFATTDPSGFLRSSREVRIRAVAAIPELLKGLKSDAEGVLQVVESARRLAGDCEEQEELTVKFYQEVYDATGTLREVHHKYPVDLGHQQVTGDKP